MMLEVSTQQDPEELVLRYLENPRSDLRDLIVVRYAPQVERVARRYAGIEPLDDLTQVGFIGLLNALSKFDQNAGVRFNTYANYLIAGEIKHYLRDRSQTIRQPAWLQELRQKSSKVQLSLQASLGRVPTTREIADTVGVTESCIEEVFAANDLLKVGSLDSAIMGDDDGSTEVERLDSADFCPEQLSLEDRLVLEHALKELRELERDVLVMFHLECLTQTEIASRLDISCNYVSHILRQSLSKLRKVLSNEEQKDRLLRRQTSSIGFEVLDELTGLYTEDYFRNRLAEEVHRVGSADSTSIAVLLLDFEGLDELSRFYGKQSVEDFLIDASDFLRDSFRRLDVVSRYSETGFAIILPSAGETIVLVQERLRTALSKWTKTRMVPSGHLKIVIGISSSPRDGKSVDALISIASDEYLGVAA